MENIRAIALMTLAMATFAVGDAMVKIASGHLSIAQTMTGMSLPALFIFGVLAYRAGDRLASRVMLTWPVVLRNTVEAATALCLVSAFSMAPLSLVVAIMQAVPLLVTIGAAVLLREKVGPRRWIAVCTGLVGVLLMLRPDTGGISLGALLALCGAVGLAARDLVTRVTPVTISTMQMALWGTFALVPGALFMFTVTPEHPAVTLPAVGVVVVASLANAIGYYAITAAMRLGDVSFVTPFRYSRLVFSLFIAVVFLAERPDALTLLGAAIVIGSGLFVMWRERNASVSGNI